MANLDTDVRYIKGVGEARAKAMERLGIKNLRDLISSFPRAYEDRTAAKKISKLVPDETVCVHAIVAAPPHLSHIRKGLDIVKLRAVDESGSIDITFFNQSYVKDSIKPGTCYVFYGKISGSTSRPAMINPLFEPEDTMGVSTGRIMPIYHLTSGISQKVMANAVRQGLNACGDVLPEYLPSDICEKYRLSKARFAYENIHFPETPESLEIARRRLVFEELFILAAAMDFLRNKRTKKSCPTLSGGSIDEFISALPFSLTGAQRRAILESVEDLKKNEPMSRLIQGDVGSGKTVVAAACCFFVWKAGCQSAFMAPTEILAEQHFKTLSDMLSPFGIHVDLLTGSMTSAKKKQTISRLTAGETDVIIGTHALISENVEFSQLALVITDEQHRFGVHQRSALTAKGINPHVLVMSATPIPRTLALIIYGDLDVSVIDELPPGRQTIDTFAVSEKLRARLYNFMRKLIDEGRQIYVVCPAVDPSENVIGLKSAQEHAKTLQNNIFPNYHVALIHGQMKTKDKAKVMSDFAGGNVDILVATTVIEVGVDVPNAALIVVENAERFGLSQLHQLRGRVGRGKHKSYCVLVSNGGGISKERLKIMCQTCDGFKISEEDLKLRGPGDFFGSRQHGLPEMHIADLTADMNVLENARKAAADVLSRDKDLSMPENTPLRERINELFELNRDTMN